MEDKMEFFITTLIVGAIIWYATRWFLKKEAEIIAKDDAAWALLNKDTQRFKEETTAGATALVNTVEKKVEETAAVVEKKVEEAAVHVAEVVKDEVAKVEQAVVAEVVKVEEAVIAEVVKIEQAVVKQVAKKVTKKKAKK
jgi:F0F1-type ATP synthase membrane subunit b/b'